MGKSLSGQQVNEWGVDISSGLRLACRCEFVSAVGKWCIRVAAIALAILPIYAAIAGPRRVASANAEVRLWFQQYEQQWNLGEIGPLMAMYDRSLTCILAGKEMQFTGCARTVAAMVERGDRAKLRLRVDSVRELGADYAMATGFVISRRGRRATEGAFTAVFVRRPNGWKLIYSQS